MSRSHSISPQNDKPNNIILRHTVSGRSRSKGTEHQINDNLEAPALLAGVACTYEQVRGGVTLREVRYDSKRCRAVELGVSFNDMVVLVYNSQLASQHDHGNKSAICGKYVLHKEFKSQLFSCHTVDCWDTNAMGLAARTMQQSLQNIFRIWRVPNCHRRCPGTKAPELNMLNVTESMRCVVASHWEPCGWLIVCTLWCMDVHIRVPLDQSLTQLLAFYKLHSSFSVNINNLNG